MKREMSKNKKKVKTSEKTSKRKKEREKQSKHHLFDFGQLRLRPISTSANFDFGQFDSQIGRSRASSERACKSGSTAREGRHRTKPLVPEAGPGGTNCVVKLLRVADGANHGMMHQIGDTLQVDGKRATLQRRPEEVKCPSQTKHEGAGNILTSERRVSSFFFFGERAASLRGSVHQQNEDLT